MHIYYHFLRHRVIKFAFQVMFYQNALSVLSEIYFFMEKNAIFCFIWKHKYYSIKFLNKSGKYEQ